MTLIMISRFLTLTFFLLCFIIIIMLILKLLQKVKFYDENTFVDYYNNMVIGIIAGIIALTLTRLEEIYRFCGFSINSLFNTFVAVTIIFFLFLMGAFFSSHVKKKRNQEN